MRIVLCIVLTLSTSLWADHSLGLKRTVESLRFIKSHPNRFMLADISIPASIDLSPAVSPPEDQGACGACWDFSLTKALRSAWMLEGKDPGRLAFNYLLDNCGPGPTMDGCNGGDFNAGQSFLNGSGPWLEAQDPYKGQQSKCKVGLKMAASAIKMSFVGNGQAPPSFQELASVVSQRHVLSVDVAVTSSWENYSGGVYSGDGSGINHMINMVGYNCESSADSAGNCKFNAQGQPVNGDGYLKVMNNWGTSWGEGGYMRTRWGKNQVAETAAYFEIDNNPPQPPVPVPTPPAPPDPPSPPNPAAHPWWLWTVIGLGAIIAVLIIVEMGRII